MKDINKIFEEKPNVQLWSTLEHKLENKKSVKKIKRYRVASLAAMFVALIAAVSYFNHLVNDHNPHLFASNEGFSSYMLEDLKNEKEGLFNMASFTEIRNAYNKGYEKNQPVALNGNYVAQDGEISLEISLKNYTYFLAFSYEGFPILELEKVEGQTLYFSSETKRIRLNLESNGLKIIDSNFLPEYKNLEFIKLNAI